VAALRRNEAVNQLTELKTGEVGLISNLVHRFCISFRNKQCPVPECYDRCGGDFKKR